MKIFEEALNEFAKKFESKKQVVGITLSSKMQKRIFEGIPEVKTVSGIPKENLIGIPMVVCETYPDDTILIFYNQELFKETVEEINRKRVTR